MGADLTVYYDGACPLCRREIAHYRGRAGAERVRFVDLAAAEDREPGRLDPGSIDLGPGLDLAAARARFHVREADGRLVSGAAAFARLWRRFPGWRWLARLVELRLFGWRPLLPFAEAAYRLSLIVRPWLARRLRDTHCDEACR
jgi:predicted DCC family thiol-disulfide oxidoreductase YuxK